MTRSKGMSDSIESKMEFIIQQHASFAVDIADLKEVQRRQAESIDRLTLNVNNVSSTVAELTVSVAELRENARQERERLDRVITEMHQGFDEMHRGFDNLIIANEVTRKLAEDIGHLAVATSHGARVQT